MKAESSNFHFRNQVIGPLQDISGTFDILNGDVQRPASDEQRAATPEDT